MKRLLAVAVLLSVSAAPQDEPVVHRGPYVQAPTGAAAMVCFETRTIVEGSVTCGGRTVRTPAGTRHEARIDRLKPGTRYEYVIAPGGLKGAFTTVPEGDVEVAFTVWGDSRTYPERLARVAARAAQDRVDFSLHTGDLVGDGDDPRDWDRFFPAARPLLSSGAFWPAFGNHEEDSKIWLDLFVLPAPEHWYTFTWGPAQVFVIDSNYGWRKDPRQLAWLRDGLAASKARFKFLCCHHPLLATPNDDFIDEDEAMSRLYGRIVEEGKVTAVFQGHNHNYQRMERNGILYLTSGGAGAPLYPLGDPTPETKFALVTLHHVRVRLKGDTMTVEGVDPDGKVFDRDERRIGSPR